MTNATAAILIIGNEILSGRTLDQNTQFIATTLNNYGIELKETRTIGDYKDFIISTVNELRAKYSYVFTTGGIGPTHDDITVESIAEAFGVTLYINNELQDFLREYYAKQGKTWNEAREKMTKIPIGAQLLVNYAPSFILGNVVVMAGIPNIMHEMLGAATKFLHATSPYYSKTLEVMKPETSFAQDLTLLQNQYPQISIGSYPFTKNNQPGAHIVMRAQDTDLLEKAFTQLQLRMN